MKQGALTISKVLTLAAEEDAKKAAAADAAAKKALEESGLKTKEA